MIINLSDLSTDYLQAKYKSLTQTPYLSGDDKLFKKRLAEGIKKEIVRRQELEIVKFSQLLESMDLEFNRTRLETLKGKLERLLAKEFTVTCEEEEDETKEILLTDGFGNELSWDGKSSIFCVECDEYLKFDMTGDIDSFEVVVCPLEDSIDSFMCLNNNELYYFKEK